VSVLHEPATELELEATDLPEAAGAQAANNMKSYMTKQYISRYIYTEKFEMSGIMGTSDDT
jgi:hypothetical protein